MFDFKNFLKKSVALIGVERTASSHLEKWISTAGAFAGISAVWWVSFWALGESAAGLMLASMGASAVLLFAVPHGTLSQPWPLIGGHLVSALIGVTCSQSLPNSPWAAPLAVAAAVGAMYYLRCIHPPGGATALTAVLGGEAIQQAGFEFIVFPVAANVACILALAVAFNWPFKWRRYPGFFIKRATPAAPRSETPVNQLTHEDFSAALQEMKSFIDVSPEDLAELFERAAGHAERNAEHPPAITAGRYYSNGLLGQRWSVRQVIDASEMPSGKSASVIYKVVAGNGAYQTGLCSETEFSLWARFEVTLSDGHWLRV